MASLNKEEFLRACKELYKRGYRRNFKMKDLYDPNTHGHFYWYYKTIERVPDKYGDMRSINQILFHPWSFYLFRDKIPNDKLFSFEPVIMFSRNSDERIDLTLSHPARSIEEIEEIAVKFGEWCKQNIREIEDNG